MNKQPENNERPCNGKERSQNARSVCFQSPLTSGKNEQARSSQTVSVSEHRRCCWWIEGPCIGDESRIEECQSCGKDTLHVACIERLLQDEDHLDNHIVCRECLIKHIDADGGGNRYASNTTHPVCPRVNSESSNESSSMRCTLGEPNTPIPPTATQKMLRKQMSIANRRIRKTEWRLALTILQ